MAKYGPYARGIGGARDVTARKAKRQRAQGVRLAKIREREYESQARAVTRVAKTQRLVGVGKPSLTATPRREARQERRRERRQERRREARVQRRAWRARQRYYDSAAARQLVSGAQAEALQRARQAERYYSSYVPKGKVLGSDLGLRGTAGRSTYTAEQAAGIIAPLGPQRERQQLASSITTQGIAKTREALRLKRAERRAASLAPALAVLDQLSRTGHASASTALQAVKDVKRGQVPSLTNPASVARLGKAALRGATLEERTIYSDVLKEAGVPGKGTRAALGFALDVAADPLTYVTGGTASVARVAATRAAREAGEATFRAARRSAERNLQQKIDAAVKEGAIDPAQAAKQRKRVKRTATAYARRRARDTERRAFERAMRDGEGARGVRVQVAGGRTARRAGRAVRRAVLPARAERTVRRLGPAAPLTRLTAAQTRAVSRLAGRRGQRAAAGARGAGTQVFAGVRAPGVSRTEQAQVKAVRREARAESERLLRRIGARIEAVSGRLADDEHDLVIDAIEADDLSRLKGKAKPRRIGARYVRDPDRLVKVAQQLRRELRHFDRIARRSGVLAGRVGVRARMPEEIAAVAPQRKRLPAAEITRRRLRDAQAAHRAAQRRYHQSREAGQPTAAAIEAVRATKAEVDRLSARREQITRGVQARAQERQEVGEAARQARRTRLSEEARGYFPRERIREERLAEPVERRAVSGPSPQRPRPGEARERELRQSRAQIRELPLMQRRRGAPLAQAQRDYLESLEPSAVESIRRYGQRIAPGIAAANLNRRIAERFGRALAPRDITPTGLASLSDEGMSVYKLERGNLTRVDPRGMKPADWRRTTAELQEAAGRRKRALGVQGMEPVRQTPGGERYVVLSDRVVQQVRTQTRATQPHPVARVFDRAQAAWKGVALATPGFLVRNLVGDAFNAYGHENGWRVLRETFRGSKALRTLGKVERAQRKLNRTLPPDKRTIKLAPEQADEIARIMGSERTYQALRKANPKLTKAQLQQMTADQLASGRFSALQVALLAERMGVIRQGRFIEIMEERGGLLRPRTPRVWHDVTKRVEDSVRIGTFLGGLRRGLDAREAANRASQIHFDYGDLTAIERNALRRMMPFYTFTSRNIPLQTKILATSPGKYAAVGKARDEAAHALGLESGYEQGLDEYEARQLGIPIRIGDDVMMVSFGSPFVDMNDIAGAFGGVAEAALEQKPQALLRAPELGVKRTLELLGPWKTIGELQANYSTFFRSQIAPPEKRRERAPLWAVAVSKAVPGFAAMTGMRDDWVDPNSGKAATGWDRRATAFFRSIMPGAAGAIAELPELARGGEGARGRTPLMRTLGPAAGVRVSPFSGRAAAETRLWNEWHQLDEQMAEMRDLANPRNGRPINADNPTPKYARLGARKRAVERDVAELEREAEREATTTRWPSVPRGELPIAQRRGTTTTTTRRPARRPTGVRPSELPIAVRRRLAAKP